MLFLQPRILLKNNTQAYLGSYKIYSKIKGRTWLEQTRYRILLRYHAKTRINEEMNSTMLPLQDLKELGMGYYYATTLKLGQMK